MCLFVKFCHRFFAYFDKYVTNPVAKFTQKITNLSSASLGHHQGLKLICTSLLICGALFGQTETPPNTTPPPQIDLFSLEETAQEAPQGNRFLGEFFYMLLMLGILIGALLIATRFLRRMTDARYDQMNVSSAIKIVERRQLSLRTTLYLLELAGKTLLIAETPTHVTRLDRVEETDRDALQT